MSREQMLSFGLLPDDEKTFLEALAGIESVDERRALVTHSTTVRDRIENGQETNLDLDKLNPPLQETESRITLFLYAQGLRSARLQQPLSTLRRIARS